MKFADLTNEQYHADRTAISKSWLDKIHRSPLHLRTYLDGESPTPTPAMQFGTAVHSFVLEPDTVNRLYVPKPDGMKFSTREGKAWRADNADKTILTSDEWRAAMACRDSVYKHKAAKALLEKGAKEQSAFYTNPDTGEVCKARFDNLLDHCVADVKTTKDASPDGFIKSIVNFRYDVQVPHYLEGPQLDNFFFICVETEPPYAVAVYRANADILKRGMAIRKRNLITYAECKSRDQWPGYSDDWQHIGLPGWAK